MYSRCSSLRSVAASASPSPIELSFVFCFQRFTITTFRDCDVKNVGNPLQCQQYITNCSKSYLRVTSTGTQVCDVHIDFTSFLLNSRFSCSFLSATQEASPTTERLGNFLLVKGNDQKPLHGVPRFQMMIHLRSRWRRNNIRYSLYSNTRMFSICKFPLLFNLPRGGYIVETLVVM